MTFQKDVYLLYSYTSRTPGSEDPLFYFVSIMPKAGLQEAHSIHLYVINASGLCARSRPSVSGSSYESTDTSYNPVGGSKIHMAYLFWSLVPVTGVPGPNQ